MRNCFYPADILLPDFKEIDGTRWACIACDQFTSEIDYWNDAEKTVGDAPSTLRLILPEIYLDSAESRTPQINAAMDEYLENILHVTPSAMIFVERVQSTGKVRRGIIGMIDLEKYEYKTGSTSLIRATEGTVLERIPPRVAVRRDASVELPHVMLLIDDPEKSVIEPLSDKELDCVYDFSLMLGGGSIKGKLLTKEEQTRVSDALEALVTDEKIQERYSMPLSPLLFAVGDGNHSLASAKAHYEGIKAKLGESALDHPARYALAEIVNLHDDALEFEPIYRVLFGVDPDDVVKELSEYLDSLDGNAKSQSIRCVNASLDVTLTAKRPVQQLTVGTLQIFIDEYLKAHKGACVDYIHGEDSVEALTRKDDSIGFLFEGMRKDMLFKTVMLDGALPRKAFSMGHARDKRYYLEARKIK